MSCRAIATLLDRHVVAVMPHAIHTPPYAKFCGGSDAALYYLLRSGATAACLYAQRHLGLVSLSGGRVVFWTMISHLASGYAGDGFILRGERDPGITGVTIHLTRGQISG